MLLLLLLSSSVVVVLVVVGDVLSAWCSCGDAGPDIRFCRKLAGAQIQQNPQCFGFDTNCMMHQAALQVEEELKQVDRVLGVVGIELPGRYFGCVARVLHTWRDTGMSKKIYTRWATISEESAVTFARRKPPKPIMGRWQQVHICESYLLAPPASELCDVVTGVLQDVMKKQPALNHAALEDKQRPGRQQAKKQGPVPEESS